MVWSFLGLIKWLLILLNLKKEKGGSRAKSVYLFTKKKVTNDGRNELLESTLVKKNIGNCTIELGALYTNLICKKRLRILSQEGYIYTEFYIIKD